MNYLAHAGQEIETSMAPGLIETLTHRPVWLSLLVVAFFLFGVYALLEKLKVKPANRLVSLLPLLILLAIFYLEHNAAVTTTLLAVGFVGAFFFAFTMMTSQRNTKPDNQNKTQTESGNKDEPDKS